MKLGEENATFISLPPNFQSNENYALGIAVDKQMYKLMEFMKRVQVWTKLDDLDARYYDYLAASIRAPYYSSEYDPTKKLAILRKSLSTYMFAGTRKAEIELINSLFEDAKFVPWYEYDGEPYHFKIVVPTDPSEETLNKFIAILERVKAKRSIIDKIEAMTYEIDFTVKTATRAWSREEIKDESDEHSDIDEFSTDINIKTATGTFSYEEIKEED